MEGSVRRVLIHEFVTGGGLAGEDLPPSWAAEGSAMRRSLALDFAAVPGIEVMMTLDHRLPDEPGPWSVVRIGRDEERAALEHWAGRVDWVIPIAPETGGILRDLAALLEPSGPTWLSTPCAIALAGDKLRLAEHWRSRGISTPESREVRPREGLPADFPYPAILKPIDGAGCVDTFTVEDRAGIPAGAREMGTAILQPDVAGFPLSASFLVAQGGIAALAHGRQEIVREGGRMTYRGGGVPIHPVDAEAQLRESLACVPGLRGWIGVDFLWNPAESRATIVEINPRLTTSFVGLARAAGPGRIASAWLALEGGDIGPARSLARELREKAPVSFLADGTILD